MFCPKCGTQVPDGVKFCPSCGNLMQAQPQAPVQPQAPAQPQMQFQQDNFYGEPAQQPAYQQPVYQDPVPPAGPAPAYNAYQEPAPQPTYNVYQEPAPQPEYYNSDGTPDDGGASTPILILGILGLAFSFSGVIGIILSAIAKGKAKGFKARFGSLFGKAKVGNGLAKAGLIIAIIMTIFWFVMGVIMGIVAAVSGADFSEFFGSGFYY